MLGGGAETMSNRIDQRIVEMSFENHKFEKGIHQSKNSLKEFSDTLTHMGSGKDFSGLENSIQSVSSSFSAFEQIGIGALRRIGEAAVDAGSRILKHLTIDPLTMGWSKYGEKTASVQTIMNATGKSIDEVNGYLARLMWFSDETSYGFTDMTSALAQMTSSGGNIDSLIPMITGVANATAYAGKGAAEFSRAMYNLNQSYGRGNLEYMDWKSLELAGVAGKDLKQIFIDTGKALGVLDAKGRTAKGTLVDIGTFGNTLQEKWANTKVMETAFGKFSELSEAAYKLVNEGKFETAAEAMASLAGQYSNIAEKAFKSAQQAKSFKEAINATLDATSSGWMRTYEIIFGELDEATRNFTQLSKILWTIFAAGAEGRNQMLKSLKDAGGIKSLFQILKNTAVALLKPLKAISQAFDQFFPPRTKKQWLDIINILETISKRLIITDETAHKIQRTFAGFFAVLDIGWQIVKFLGSALYEVVGIFIPLNGNLLELTASVGDFLVILNHLIKQSGVFQYGLLGIKVAATIARDVLSSTIKKVSEFISTLMRADKPLDFIGQTLQNVFSGLFDTLKKGIVWISSKFVGAISGVQKVLATKLNIDSEGFLGGVLKVLKEFIEFLMGGATDGLSNFGDALRNLDFSRIATFVTGGILLVFINQLSNLTKSMADVLTSTNTFVTKFTKKLFGTTTKIKDLAYVFGILTVSLYVLSQIPWKDMKKGLAGLAGAIVLFVGAYASIQAITVLSSKALNGVEVIKTTLNLASLASGLAIMAFALNKISKIDEGNIWKSVGVMGAMMGLLTAYQALSALISIIPGQHALSMNFAGMTFGLLGLVGVIALLNVISPQALKNGLGKLAVAILALAAIQSLFSFAAGISGGHKLSLNLLGIVGGLLALLGVMKLLSLINAREISQGIGNVLLLGGVFAAIQLMFNIAGRVGGGVKFRTNVFAMQVGIMSMIALVAILGTMKKSTLQNGISNLAKMAGIIAGLEILTALAARIGGGNKLQKILGSVSLTMLSFVALIAILSIPTKETIDQGLITIAKMMVMILAFETLSAFAGSIGNNAKGVGAIVGMVSALLAVTASLLLLSMIDQVALRKATKSLAIAVASMGVLASGVGLMAKSLSLLSTGLSGLKAIVTKLLPGFVAMGIIILATVGLLKVIDMTSIEKIKWSSLGRFAVGLGLLTTLVTAFTLLTKVPALNGEVKLIALVPGFAAMIAVVVATAGLLVAMSLASSKVDNISWSNLGKFTLGLGVITTLATAFTLLSKVSGLPSTKGLLKLIPGFVVAIAGVGLVIGAFVGLSSLLEKLFQKDPEFLVRGIDKLVLVGEGLGRFMGSIVGGFSAEVLTGYGEGLAGFAAAVGQIDPASFDGVESLARALLVLTGAALLDGLSKFVNSGKNPGEVFGEQLKGLIQSFNGITAEDVTRTTSVISLLAPMSENLKKLAEATQAIPNSGGLLGGLLGNNDADEFGDQLRGFIQDLGRIAVEEAQHASNVLVALGPMVLNLKNFARAADGIPNTGGLISGFLGDNDVDTFGSKLIGFIRAFKGLDAQADVAKASAAFEAMGPMATNLKDFATAAQGIPNSGGVVAWFTGNNDLQKFGEKVAGFAKSFGDLDTSQVANANNNLKAMTNEMLPGLERFATLTTNLSNLGGGWAQSLPLLNFATTLKEFVKILGGVDVSVVAPALKSLSEINGSFRVIGSEIIASATKSFENNKQPFQVVIVKFLNDIIKMVDSKKQPIANSFTTILSGALTKSKTYVSSFKALGSDLVRGLKNGIVAEQRSAINAAVNMTRSVTLASQRGFQTNSPSKVFDGIGRWLPIGLGNGIKHNTKVAVFASTSMAQGVENAIRNSLGVHSESKLFNNIGGWIPTSIRNGIQNGKQTLLKTAGNLGLDTGDITVKGISKSLSNGEGAVTSGITSLLDILTGKQQLSEVASSLGIKAGAATGTATGTSTGNAFAKSYAKTIGSGANTSAVNKAYGTMAQDAFEIFKASIDYRKEYNLISLEQEIAEWESFAKRYAEGTEIRMKADKEIDRLKFENSKIWIDKEKYYKRLSLLDELAAWERVQARYKKGHEYRMQAEREIFRLKQEIWQAEYQNALDFIDEEKYYGRMNLTQELKEWKKIISITEEASDERKKADREIFRLEKEIYETNLSYEEKLRKIESDRYEKSKQLKEDYYAKEKEINDKLSQDIQSLNNEYESALKSRTQTLYSTWGLFDKVDTPQNVTGSELIKNLEDQVVAFDQWQAQISTLSQKGVGRALIGELRDMGPQSLAQIVALNKLSSPELDKYVALWGKKSKEAKDQATYELRGMKEETKFKIKELTSESREELESYKDAWDDALEDLNKDNKRQLNELETDWVGSLGGMTAEGLGLIQRFRLEWFGELAAMVVDTRNQMSQLQGLTQSSKAAEAATAAMSTALRAIDTKSLGLNTAIGLSNGALGAAGLLTQTGIWMGKTLLGGAYQSTDSHSPSREFMKLGKFCIDGLVGGLQRFSGLVSTEGGRVGRTALEAVSLSMNSIPEALEDPNMFTITPVLDLSNVRSGMYDINSIFNSVSGLDLGATMGLLPVSSPTNQNGILTDIKNGLLALTNPEVDVSGMLTVQVVNDKGEIIGIAETAIKDMLRRESR